TPPARDTVVEEADAPAVGVHQAVFLTSWRIRLNQQAARWLEHQRRDGSRFSEPAEMSAHQTSQARRTPEKICRRIGWSQLRKLGRRMPGATAHEPPRSTL